MRQEVNVEGSLGGCRDTAASGGGPLLCGGVISKSRGGACGGVATDSSFCGSHWLPVVLFGPPAIGDGGASSLGGNGEWVERQKDTREADEAFPSTLSIKLLLHNGRNIGVK